MFKKSLFNKSALLGLALSACSLPVVAQQSLYLLDDNLTVLDAQTGAITMEVPNVGGGTGSGSSFVFESTNGQFLYASYHGGLTVTDLNSGVVARYPVSGSFGYIDKSQVDDYLYFAGADPSNPALRQLSKMDPNNGNIIAGYSVGEGINIADIAVHPLGEKIYVLLHPLNNPYYDARIVVLETQTMTVTDEIMPRNQGVFIEYTSNMYMSNSGDKIVMTVSKSDPFFGTRYQAIINTADNSLVASDTHLANGSPRGVGTTFSKDDSKLISIVDRNSIQVYDIASESVVANIALPLDINDAPADLTDVGVSYTSFDIHPNNNTLYAYGWDYHLDQNGYTNTEHLYKLVEVDLTTYTADKPTYTVPKGSFDQFFAGEILFSRNSSNPGLEAKDVTASFVRCQNYTTGQIVDFVPQPGETTWSCKDHGLLYSSGDDVLMAVRGNVQ